MPGRRLTLPIEQEQQLLREDLGGGQVLHGLDDDVEGVLAELLVEGQYQGNNHVHQVLRIVALDDLQQEAGKVYAQIVCQGQEAA